MVSDDERREVARRLRELASDAEEVSDFDLAKTLDLGAVSRYGYDPNDVERLADLIEPAPTSSDGGPTSDPTERGVDSIYDWCFAAIEGADGPEDYLYCSIMSAIEEYRHPERVTARIARPVDREALRSVATGLRSLGEREVLSAGAAREIGDEIMEAIGETVEEVDES